MTTPDEIVSSFYDAYNRHDAVAAVGLYEEACSHADVAFGAVREGRAALVEGLSGFFRMMPDAVWRERERVVSGASVAVVYTLTGHVAPRGRPGEAPAAARAIDLPGIHLFELGEGGIRSTRDYWDAAEFRRQMG